MKRHTNIVASYLVLEKDNQVLLSRRFNTGYRDGMYSLVAGHVDDNETFTQALVREVKEEASIIIDPLNIKFVHTMHRKSEVDGSQRVDVFFLMSKYEGTLEIMEKDKCDELTWFDKDKLPSNIIKYV